MSGAWTGPGRIEFDGGTSEALVCKAYYTTTDHSDGLSIAGQAQLRRQHLL